MKTYVFPYYISYGKLDNESSEIEYTLTEKDSKRLERSAKEGGRFHLFEDDDIADIYDKIYQEVVEALHHDQFFLETHFEGFNCNSPIANQQIDEYLSSLAIGINYPEELQFLERTIRLPRKTTDCKSLYLTRETIQEQLKDVETKKCIIYVDNGETLYSVPKDYAGKFTIPSSVIKIEEGAFENRRRIREIEIEKGLSTIPEWAFEGCEGLEKITVPSSVKTIEYNAFTKCYNLKVVDLAEGLLEIHNTAFRFCYELEKIRIPSTVQTICGYIISNDNGLRHFYFLGDKTTIDGKFIDEWQRRVIMHVLPNSEAEKYAKQNGIKYIVD